MSFQTFAFKRSETLEVFINNTSTSQFKFTDNETTLDGIHVVGLIVQTQAVGTTFGGKQVVPDAIAKRAFLTLATSGNNQRIKRIPLENFFANNKVVLEFNKLDVDLRKSFIELQDRTGLTTDMAFLITFFYEKSGD